jgi:hypothetical protein
VKSWDVVFDDPAVGRRGFATEAERAAFIASSLSDVTLEPLAAPEERERAHVLAGGLGEALTEVTFVADYVQLRFDGGPLNLFVWPRVRRGRGVLRRGDIGYADVLVGLIGNVLVAVDELLDRGLVLAFADGTCLTVALDGTDLLGAEIATYGGMVWSPGDF